MRVLKFTAIMAFIIGLCVLLVTHPPVALLIIMSIALILVAAAVWEMTK